MNDQDNESRRWATLDYSVRQRLNISWGEYVLLDMVYHLSGKYGHCFKSVGYMAIDLGLSKPATYSMIDRLVDRELLVKDNEGLRVTDAYTDIAYLQKHDVHVKARKSKETLLNDKKELRNFTKKLRNFTQSKETFPKNNNIELQKTKKLNKKDFEKIFVTLCSAINSKAKYSPSYERLLAKACKTFTEEELLQAIQHFKWKFEGGSQWHSEHRKFYTLKQFLSGDKNNVPRYETCLEELTEHKANKPIRQAANPRLAEFFGARPG